MKAYGFFAALIWLLYVGAIIIGERRRLRVGASRKKTAPVGLGVKTQPPMRGPYGNQVRSTA